MARNQTDRRTVLRTIGTLAAAGVGVTGASTAATASRQEIEDSSGGVAARTALAGSTSPSGLYRATVDRIVDGDHVVILVEDDGAVVAEVVQPREQYPDLKERDRILVWLHDGDLIAVW